METRGVKLGDSDAVIHLETLVRQRTEALWEAVTAMERTAYELRASDERWVDRMLRAARFKDDETAAHIQRMSHYCELLAGLALDNDHRAEGIGLASRLHDVGKVAIPDEILLKMGTLTEEEKAVMQTHTLIGRTILGDAHSGISLLAGTIAMTHHERWDGVGYPLGLAGDAIPIEGRMAAIADTFDALTTHRIYRRAFQLPDAIRKMKVESGKQFDAGLLALFLNHMDEALDIQHRFPDL